MLRRLTPLLAAILAFSPAAATAQVYDAPSFRPPGSEQGLGFYAISLAPGDDPGADVAALATWRMPGSDLDLGLRAGAGEITADLALLGGVEIEQSLVASGADAPVAVAWTSGMGVGTVPDRNSARIRVPAGITLGQEIPMEGYALLPYAHPRLAVDLFVRDDPPGGPGDEAELNFDLDLGADVVFEEGWRLRFGVTVGSSAAVGFGIGL